MSFIPQIESEVEKGWPKIGKHLGLLSEDPIREVPINRISSKYKCCNEYCAGRGGIFKDEPDSMASINSYSCSWCGHELVREKLEQNFEPRLPFDTHPYQSRKVYQDEIGKINRWGCIDFVSPVQGWKYLCSINEHNDTNH